MGGEKNRPKEIELDTSLHYVTLSSLLCLLIKKSVWLYINKSLVTRCLLHCHGFGLYSLKINYIRDRYSNMEVPNRLTLN